ncbi:MAG: serine/threonine protein kinase, partial [Planctomyces sp.]
YCIGSATAAASKPTATAVSRESALSDRKVAQVLLTPTEQILKPGEKLQLQVLGYNKAGQLLGPVKGAVVTAEGGGAVSADLVYTAPASGVAGVVLTAKSGELAAKARLRVIPQLPWKFDFADEKVPPVWIGADYRHKPAPLDGQKGLVKISTIPKGTRSQAWLGWTNLHDYTIQADFKATQRGDRLPDMGLINQRYTLDLQGAQRLQIRSWTARLELRFAKTMDFNWQADTWYTMKFRSETEGGKVTLRGKVWKRGESEPSEWQIEATDEVPNLQGSPGLFGNATDAEFFVDNVAVSSNQK